jgi:hypothetical protein
MTLAAAGRFQPRFSQLTNGRIGSAARCYHPASVGVATDDMAAEQPPLAAERLAGLLQESLGRQDADNQERELEWTLRRA